MAISFNEIPQALRVPGAYNEIDNSLAGNSTDIKNVLIWGQMLSTGTATALEVHKINSLAQARDFFGRGSQLTIMCEHFLTHNTELNLYAQGITDPDGATSNVKIIELTGTSTKNAGVVNIYVNDKKIQTVVAESTTIDDIGASLELNINAINDLPVEATYNNVNKTIKLKTINTGVIGNDIKIEINKLETEKFPIGITTVINDQLETKAVGEVNLTNAIANLGDVYFNYFVCPFVDLNNLKLLKNELDRRYRADIQMGARAFIAYEGNLTELETFSTTINSPHITCLGLNKGKQSSWICSVIYCAHLSKLLANDPSQPLNNLKLTGLIAPATNFNDNDRNKLLFAGIATWKLGVDGSVYLERPITTYIKTSDGTADSSYLDIQIPETLDAIRNYRNSEIRKKFIEFKLSDGNERFAPGVKVMTTSVFKGFLLDLYKRVFIEEKAWVQDYEKYKENLLVEVDSEDKSRINYQEQPTLIGQFYIAAGITQFK